MGREAMEMKRVLLERTEKRAINGKVSQDTVSWFCGFCFLDGILQHVCMLMGIWE